MINEIVLFPIFIAIIAMEINSFNTIMQLINPNYPWKNDVKQTKINQEKLSQSSIFFPIVNNSDPSSGVKK